MSLSHKPEPPKNIQLTNRKKWLNKINLFMMLWVVLFIFHSTLYAYDSLDAPTVKANSLLTKAQNQGKISVIVTLKMPKKMPTASVEQDHDHERIKSIKWTQEQVLKRLQVKKEKIFATSTYRFTPQIALSVTASGLKSLMLDSYVEHLHEDVFIQGAVGESVPKIFPSYQSSAYSGEGWTVAILDTGVDKFHPAFENRVIDEACYSSNANFPNYYSLCPSSTPDVPIKSSTATGSGVDCQAQLDNLKSLLRVPNTGGTACTHGTGVAGVAAGDFGRAQGVARDANVMAIQVFTAVNDNNETPNDLTDDTLSVGAFSSDILKGLEHVYALRNTHKIAAANISISGLDENRNAINTEAQCESARDLNKFETSILRPIIQLLKQAGIATVIASGNNDVEDGVGTFACIREAIAVGATDNNDNKYDVCDHSLQPVLHSSPAIEFNGTSDPSSYPTRNCGSNSGDLLDLWAPGVAIETALATSAGGGTEINSGTSEAAPHVAGAWAVMKQKNPNATVDMIENAFKTTGQPITVGGVTRQRINIDEALQKIGNGSVNEDDPSIGVIDACQQGQTPVGNEGLTINAPICLQDVITRRDQRQMAFYVEADKVGLTLSIQLSHGVGDAILLHRYDRRPTHIVYDNISNNLGNEELIRVNNVQEGWNYIHVQTESEFSGVTLKLRYREDDSDDMDDNDGEPPSDTENPDLVDACQQGQVPVGNVSLVVNTPVCLQDTIGGDQRQMAFYVVAEKAGLTLEIQLGHGSGNGVLLHRYDSRPTRTVYDNISDNRGNEERILVNNVQEGWNYVHVQTESEFSGVTLHVRYFQD